MENIPESSYQDLAASSIFSSFTVHEIRELLNRVRCDFHRYHKNAYVAFQGDEYDRLLLLTRGTLVAEIVDQKGVSLTVENLVGPSPVATGILFAGDAVLPVQLRAKTDAEVISLSRQSVLNLCRYDERFLVQYLRDSGDKIAFLAEKIRLLRFTTIRQKIAVYFLDLANRQGTMRLTLPHSLDTIADIFGVTRPALSRCLAQLVDENLLQRDGRDYIIATSEGLKGLLER